MANILAGLPRSTIVFGLLTAVPFGLAIKDTITGTPPSSARHADGGDDDGDAEAGIERWEREERERIEREEAERAALRGMIAAMIPEAKEAGLRLGAYRLGAPMPASTTPELDALRQRTGARLVPVEDGAGNLLRLTVSFPNTGEREICSLIEERLDAAWGESSRSYTDGETRAHYMTTPLQRVTFTSSLDAADRCMLVVEPTVAPADFASRSEAAIVPLWAVGKPAKVLVTKLGDTAFSDATQIRWSASGVGAGIAETELYARVVKGTIVTVSARFQASPATILAVHEALTAQFGEPVADGTEWPKAKLVLVTADENAGTYQLLAGELVPEPQE